MAYQPAYHHGAPDFPPPAPAPAPGGNYHQPHGQYQDLDWDGKSTKSYQSTYAGSQVHLVPGYEMTEVQPPLPTMPYQQYPPQNYPPAQQLRPPMNRGPSTGYSDARQKLLNRRSVRQVELQQGNLVLDMQVPSHIIPAGKNDEELTKLRYTAATCDPDDFMRSKYTLRPYLLGRHTELFIVMTMYNEDEVLFCRTMNA